MAYPISGAISHHLLAFVVPPIRCCNISPRIGTNHSLSAAGR